jgi:hypothetical protein
MRNHQRSQTISLTSLSVSERTFLPVLGSSEQYSHPAVKALGFLMVAIRSVSACR